MIWGTVIHRRKGRWWNCTYSIHENINEKEYNRMKHPTYSLKFCFLCVFLLFRTHLCRLRWCESKKCIKWACFDACGKICFKIKPFISSASYRGIVSTLPILNGQKNKQMMLIWNRIKKQYTRVFNEGKKNVSFYKKNEEEEGKELNSHFMGIIKNKMSCPFYFTLNLKTEHNAINKEVEKNNESVFNQSRTIVHKYIQTSMYYTNTPIRHYMSPNKGISCIWNDWGIKKKKEREADHDPMHWNFM